MFVTPHGFEPQLLRSERSVLPLDDGVEKLHIIRQMV
jgi:hypothetical protein